MRNTLFIFALCVVLVLSCAGCAVQTQDVPDGSPQPTAKEQEDASIVEDPTAQYIRTGGNGERVDFTPEVVSSPEELYAFYERYKLTINLWHKERLYVDTTIGFIDAVEKYDEAFFKENALVFIYLIEPSGSIRHHVNSVSVNDGTLKADVDTLRPGFGTDDMADWLIIIQVPGSFAQAQTVEVVNERVDWEADYEDVGRPDDVQFVSDGAAVQPYKALLEMTTFDEQGNAVTTDGSPGTFEEIMNRAPQLTVGSGLKLEIPYNCSRPEDFVLYNESLEEIERPQEVTAGTIAQHGPGVYYLSMKIRQEGEYNDTAHAYEKFEYACNIKLLLPPEDFGMSAQLRSLAAFDWQDVDGVAVENTAADGSGGDTVSESKVIEWTDEQQGLARFISLLRSRDELPGCAAPEEQGYTQRILLYDAEGEVLSIRPHSCGIYVKTPDGEYALIAPPWLFELLVEAAAGGRLLPFEEAADIARSGVIDSIYGEYFNEQSAAYGELSVVNYGRPGWIILLKAQPGGTDISVEVLDYYIIEIKPADEAGQGT